MKTVHIHRYLFWMQDNMIVAVQWKNRDTRKCEVMKPGGEKRVPFAENYWRTWKEYAGWCEGDRTDFCFIYDSEPWVDEELGMASCDKFDCAWNVAAIERVAGFLEISEPTEIRSEAGDLITRVGNFSRKNRATVTLKAHFTKSEREVLPMPPNPDRDTPFLKYLTRKCDDYIDNYES